MTSSSSKISLLDARSDSLSITWPVSDGAARYVLEYKFTDNNNNNDDEQIEIGVTRIKKLFVTYGLYEGEVIDFDPKTNLYRVLYLADNEYEDLPEREILRLKVQRSECSGSDDNEDQEGESEEDVSISHRNEINSKKIDTDLSDSTETEEEGESSQGDERQESTSSEKDTSQAGSSPRRLSQEENSDDLNADDTSSGGKNGNKSIPAGVEVIEIDSSSDEYDQDEDDEVEVVAVKSPPSHSQPSKQQQPSLSKFDPSSAETSLLLNRRSQRERTSTVTYIQGQAVLKSNNYVVKGMTYQYGRDTANEPPPSKRKNLSPSSASQKKKPKKERIQRKRQPHEIRLQEHNEKIRRSKASKQSLRLDFLKRNKNTLKPFLEESVYNRLCDSTIPSIPSSRRKFRDASDVDQPSLITGGAMRDYQLEGLRFMVGHYRWNLGTILGDEMGLGKTLQSISLICHLKEKESKSGPSLIVCPLSVMSSWLKELNRWAPSLKVYRLHSSGREEQNRQRTELRTHLLGTDEDPTPYDVVLTSYEMLKVKPFQSTWHRVHFNYLILDEGHKVKGHTTDLATAVRRVHSENQLLLTGTPLQNNLVELWSLLNIMYSDVFTTLEPFKKAFDLNNNRIDKEMLIHAQGVLKLIMLRRLKDRVEKLIPSKLETTVYCPLSSTQRMLYKSLLMKDLDVILRVEQGSTGQTNRHLLCNLFMQLRKCSQHPYLFDGVEPEEGAEISELVGVSGKVAVLDMLLSKLCQQGHRVVLFSQFTMVLDILCDYAVERGWNFARLDGSTPRAERDHLVNKYNGKNSPIFLLMMSTKAGGQGLNLQSADTCILFDSDWNPSNDLQAQARVHRIGQNNAVHIYRLISAGTIEERMLERAQKKLLLDQSVNCDNSDDQNYDNVKGLGAAELLADIKFGAQAVFGGNANNKLPTEADIELITDRTRKESDTSGKLRGNAEYNALDFDSSKNYIETQQFEGVDFKYLRLENEKKTTENLPKSLREIGDTVRQAREMEGKKRQKKSRIMMLASNNSGYGKALVPVLASNNYDIEKGECSVYQRELIGRDNASSGSSTKAKVVIEKADFCMICLDTIGCDNMVSCKLCPTSFHKTCAHFPLSSVSCPHHRCMACGKDVYAAGGILFPCSVCPSAYCEGCLPSTGVRHLEHNERWVELGYNPAHLLYIHCSERCERDAVNKLGWVPEPGSIVQTVPMPLNVEHNFVCGEADKNECATTNAMKTEASDKRRRRCVTRKEPAEDPYDERRRCFARKEPAEDPYGTDEASI
mmetsp:Transcript_5770/g.14053  ORF Transcript_5770/g.14053 Transcript_5770/m.14053 type:complete len:1276 (+) Transcript_5770:133-3960(+)